MAAIQPEVKTENAITKIDEAYMAEHRNQGLINIGGEDLLTPVLKVVQSTSKDRDVNGTPFRPGQLYYKATSTVYDQLDVVMLAVTKGKGQSYIDKTVEQSQFVFMGVILPDMLPFKFYAQGSQEYEARKFLTNIRMTRKPMYTQKIHVTVEKLQNDKGEWYIARLNVVGTMEDAQIPTLEKLVTMYMGALEQDNKEGTENVNPDDIPF